MKKPTFYNYTHYDKTLIVVATEDSLKKTCAGFAGKTLVNEEIELDIEILDTFADFSREADCKIGSFTKNFYFRTPNGVNCKYYKNRAQLEKSVKISVAKRGFKFVRWGEPPTWKRRPVRMNLSK